MKDCPLRIITPTEFSSLTARGGADENTMAAASLIVSAVRRGGEQALRQYAEELDDFDASSPLVIGPAQQRSALDRIGESDRKTLERTAARIGSFAGAQRVSLSALDVPIPGGRAGHTIEPIARAACYAPGGRYPLPSSVLMTAVTARAAGCEFVAVVSPNASDIMLAAAAIARADAFIPLGGAHAIAALAYGAGPIEPVDIIVGPGNKWVTAAKRIVSGDVAIDMLAGPSELLVIADDSADPAIVAADLLAQAEHDDDARPFLLTTSESLARRTQEEVLRQLEDLPTSATASRALRNGAVCVVDSIDDAIRLADRLAPEHLELLCDDAEAVASRIRNAGALFIGAGSAEVFGDYGFGPNHTLPTGGEARTTGGLSVLNFLRCRTWMRLDGEPDPIAMADAEALARMEGLAGHEEACRIRMTPAASGTG